MGYPHTGYNVGGIAGRQSGRVLGCTNAGEVTARKDVGGIVGQVEPYTSWNVTGTGLGEVQSQLYRLESLLRTTLGDFGDSQAEARALMQQILELLGNCSDIIGGMYPDIPWPTPGGDTGDAGGGSDNGDAGSGDDSTGGWIDPGSGSMDDLSDNLQQIVNLLGQMTDVFTSDAVIEDMQNVLSQLMNVSSAIMSMAYSLGNASVQLEDISDTDDDDEALCLIAQCANTASITADTNVGGIAGNVSLDISFDREDQLNISSTLIGSGKYEIFARISSCENSASVAASKSWRRRYRRTNGLRSRGRLLRARRGDNGGGVCRRHRRTQLCRCEELPRTRQSLGQTVCRRHCRARQGHLLVQRHAAL